MSHRGSHTRTRAVVAIGLAPVVGLVTWFSVTHAVGRAPERSELITVSAPETSAEAPTAATTAEPAAEEAAPTPSAKPKKTKPSPTSSAPRHRVNRHRPDPRPSKTRSRPTPTRTAPVTTSARAGQSHPTAEARALTLTNRKRAEYGASPLVVRSDLRAFARRWARHMRRHGFAHSTSADTRYLVRGNRWGVGENIVWWSDASLSSRQAADKLMDMWFHSPGHLQNMTRKDYSQVGIGFYHDSSGWWAVQEFGATR